MRTLSIALELAAIGLSIVLQFISLGYLMEREYLESAAMQAAYLGILLIVARLRIGRQ
jgi:hypothetical protein